MEKVRFVRWESEEQAQKILDENEKHQDIAQYDEGEDGGRQHDHHMNPAVGYELITFILLTDDLRLVVVDKHGMERGRCNILSITGMGTVYLHSGLGDAFGFQLDKHQQVGMDFVSSDRIQHVRKPLSF